MYWSVTESLEKLLPPPHTSPPRGHRHLRRSPGKALKGLRPCPKWPSRAPSIPGPHTGGSHGIHSEGLVFTEFVSVLWQTVGWGLHKLMTLFLPLNTEVKFPCWAQNTRATPPPAPTQGVWWGSKRQKKTKKGGRCTKNRRR